MQRKSRNNKSYGRRKQNRAGVPRGLQLLTDESSYSGQQKFKQRLRGTVSMLTTTVTSGVIANARPIDTTQIISFATRFGDTYDEYRILGADIEITPVTPNVAGVTSFFFDEKSASTPNANMASGRSGLTLQNSSNANVKRVMRFRVTDLLDLQYSPIGTTTTVGYFKTYTDNASFGSPTTVTQLWTVRVDLHVEFRGIRSV